MAHCLPPCGIQRLQVSQVSVHLMRGGGLGTEAKAAFEQGDATTASASSMQLLETTQEKMLSARHCPRYLPSQGFCPSLLATASLSFPGSSSLGHLFTEDSASIFEDSSGGCPFKRRLVSQAVFHAVSWLLEHYPGKWEPGI